MVIISGVPIFRIFTVNSSHGGFCFLCLKEFIQTAVWIVNFGYFATVTVELAQNKVKKYVQWTLVTTTALSKLSRYTEFADLKKI